ncbi:hypothetical protein PINS_up000719 [Pythium insidiosum]|nr:hypothetical protein PINS_up000719 [Pythium insidiosum]
MTNEWSERLDLLERYRKRRAGALHPFGTLTLRRTLLTIVTYGLFLSDVLRTGLGVRKLELASVNPDVRVLFGPYNYPIVHLTMTNASLPTSTQRFWSYKYDSTSLSMRAVAKTLGLSTWSPCLLYESTCNEIDGLPGSVVFSMLDELIERVGKRVAIPPSRQRNPALEGRLAMRIEHQFRDRLNEAVLPSLFYRTHRRTCQASFYSWERLRRYPVCDPHGVHPFGCRDQIMNFNRLCGLTGSCEDISTVPLHITRRLQMLQRAYPNASLELVVLDDVEDFPRGAHISHGRHDFDVVTLVRVRQCSRGTANCTTIAVDDYRYEAAVLAASEQEWFTIVALLRGTGQAYAWLRVASLLAGIIAAESHASAPWSKKARVVLRTFLIIPSHIVVYGSIVPVVCYAAAHALDSNIVYEQVRKDFNALRGFVNFSFGKFIGMASISMRTVWIIALVGHVVVWLSTRRSWSPSLGVPGVPELFIAFISSCTVLAHFRFKSWRDCRITQIHEIPSSQRLRDIRAESFDTARGSLHQFVLGSTSDVQFISLALVGVSLVVCLGWWAQRLLGASLRYRIAVVSYTRVPYSSTWLWPGNALVVNWANSVTHATRREEQTMHEPPPEKLFVESEKNPFKSQAPPVHRKTSRRLTVFVRPLQHDSSRGDVMHDPLLEIDHRTRGAVAFIATLNLTVLSDPLLFNRLRSCRLCKLVGLYECPTTGKLWLLPLASSVEALDIPVDWEALQHLAVFSTCELSWLDLLYCG